MPELPEVYNLAERLNDKVSNKKIKNFVVLSPKNIKNVTKPKIEKSLTGQKIKRVYSYAKYLIFETEKYNIVTHQRMEGKYLLDVEPSKHDIFKMEFNGFEISMQDFRKFSTVDLYNKGDDLPFYEKIGPEPWDVDVDDIYERIKNKIIPIKSTLLDQKYMSGLGNIYVDEVLFASKISPTRKTNEISKKELKTIIENSISILNKAKRLGGSSIKTYSALEKPGKYQKHLKVHTKEGHLCPGGDKVKKIKVNGRGTYYCERYQK